MNLFDFDFEPAPAPKALVPTPEAPETPEGDRIFVPSLAHFDRDLHAYAFAAVARYYGHADSALSPCFISTSGRRQHNLTELTRFANELLRGVRSDRPAMTSERWGEATARVLELAGVKLAGQKTPHDWARERGAFAALTCRCGSPLALVGARWECLTNCGKVAA